MKRIISRMPVILFTLLLLACPPEPGFESQERILLNKNRIEIIVGYSDQLFVHFFPYIDKTPTVIWTSSDETVVAVDSSGLISGIKGGEAIITATIEDPPRQEECIVTVYPVPIEVSLDKSSISLVKGETEQLQATIYPSDAVRRDVIWSSNDESVAKISSTGLITATGSGETVILVRTEENGLTAECTVCVCYQKINASDADEYDEFGRAVSIDGDYAIIGAFRNDNSGSAYIFYRNQGGMNNWGEVKKLTASDGEYGDKFGYSVSISGDYALVGASYGDAGFNDTGAAYLFYRNQGGTDNWGELKKLIASDADSSDMFGQSVSINGDFALIGAIEDDYDRGAAYIFQCDYGGTDNWGEVIKLTDPDAEPDEEFGCAVSIDGSNALIGARFDMENGNGSGSAFIFNRNQGGTAQWGLNSKLSAYDPENWQWFGMSVSITSEFIMIGANQDSEYGNDSGAVYLFEID